MRLFSSVDQQRSQSHNHKAPTAWTAELGAVSEAANLESESRHPTTLPLFKSRPSNWKRCRVAGFLWPGLGICGLTPTPVVIVQRPETEQLSRWLTSWQQPHLSPKWQRLWTTKNTQGKPQLAV